ncbi:MAG: hypothetical protein ABF250_08290 [Polaribacter sp.]|uniref:hypothetical protein n=1 Tax=Polaribacter sp. TaxID=1920175 RepID=UPI0032193785
MITVTELKDYFKRDLKTEPRHNLRACKKAFNTLNNEVQTDVYDLVYLIFENKPIRSLHTHSYGFHTANGRHLIETFKNLYERYDH